MNGSPTFKRLVIAGLPTHKLRKNTEARFHVKREGSFVGKDNFNYVAIR
jgi:hypothetical protein